MTAEALRDGSVLAARSIRMTVRRPDALLTVLLMPILLMLVFGYLFGGAIQPGTGYVGYLVPGVMLTCVVLASSTTAVSVTLDLSTGVIDRFRSLDVGGPAFLAGHVAASVLRNAITSVLVVAIALPMGFRPAATPLGWLAAAGLILGLALTVSWLSALSGLLFTSPEAASGLTFFMMLVPFTSSSFVPIATMPAWLRGFVRHQPATLVVESVRNLLTGRPAGTTPWQAAAWCTGLVLGSILLSGAAFARRLR